MASFSTKLIYSLLIPLLESHLACRLPGMRSIRIKFVEKRLPGTSGTLHTYVILLLFLFLMVCGLCCVRIGHSTCVWKCLLFTICEDIFNSWTYFYFVPQLAQTTLIQNRFRTNLWNLLISIPNWFRNIFWHSVLNHTAFWKSILLTLNYHSGAVNYYVIFY